MLSCGGAIKPPVQGGHARSGKFPPLKLLCGAGACSVSCNCRGAALSVKRRAGAHGSSWCPMGVIGPRVSSGRARHAVARVCPPVSSLSHPSARLLGSQVGVIEQDSCCIRLRSARRTSRSACISSRLMFPTVPMVWVIGPGTVVRARLSETFSGLFLAFISRCSASVTWWPRGAPGSQKRGGETRGGGRGPGYLCWYLPGRGLSGLEGDASVAGSPVVRARFPGCALCGFSVQGASECLWSCALRSFPVMFEGFFVHRGALLRTWAGGDARRSCFVGVGFQSRSRWVAGVCACAVVFGVPCGVIRAARWPGRLARVCSRPGRGLAGSSGGARPRSQHAVSSWPGDS